MSVTHELPANGQKVTQALYEAAHLVADASITGAMLVDAYDAEGAAAAAQAASDPAGTAAAAVAALSSVYQPLDSDLTAIAALTTTSFGRGLLTSANAAALRTSAALGTLATQSGTFSGTSSGTNTGDQTLASLGAMSQAQALARGLGS